VRDAPAGASSKLISIALGVVPLVWTRRSTGRTLSTSSPNRSTVPLPASIGSASWRMR
jgi:hypothetical protein